jgi:hypothetical protein
MDAPVWLPLVQDWRGVLTMLPPFSLSTSIWILQLLPRTLLVALTVVPPETLTQALSDLGGLHCGRAVRAAGSRDPALAGLYSGSSHPWTSP